MKLDWQHVVILALAIAGAVVVAVLPKAAPYAMPVEALLVSLALGKQSPLQAKAEEPKP